MRVEVVGPLRVAGARKGEIVNLDPTRVNIPALVEAGHVRPVSEPSKKAKAKE